MPQRSAGRSFRQINLAHTDDFGTKNDKIRLWVINNGGTFSKELNDEVTHLVCSKKAWKKYHAIVRDARRRRIKVVSLEWLEDSLLSSNRRPRAEKKYEWETMSRRQRGSQKAIQGRTDDAIKKSIAKFDGECLDFETMMQNQGHHIYLDSIGFSYSIILARAFLLESRLEKLSLKLFESNAMPHTYACYVKYTRHGVSGSEVLAILGSSWQLAFDAFTKFFQAKTMTDWNDRLDGKLAPAANNGNTDDLFRYEPSQPSLGAHKGRSSAEQEASGERIQKAQLGDKNSVTMIVPTITISDDDDDDKKAHLRLQASTPEGTEW